MLPWIWLLQCHESDVARCRSLATWHLRAAVLRRAVSVTDVLSHEACLNVQLRCGVWKSVSITGSIGVILRGNNLEKLLERVGIRFETVKSGLYKDILSPDKPLSEGERSILQALIDSSYSQFVAAVAQGRKLSEETVRSFADGRVFSGAQALELGMVDLLGDEDTARREAARDEEAAEVKVGQRGENGVSWLCDARDVVRRQRLPRQET